MDTKGKYRDRDRQDNRPSLRPKHDVLRLRHCVINAFQYRKSAGDVMNYTLSPKLLGHKTKDRPGLVDPLAYYLARCT